MASGRRPFLFFLRRRPTPSAYIIGSLPFVVFTLVWFINPKYMADFFIDERLIVAGLGGLIWMSIGGFIMAKMVNFEI